MKWLVSRLKLLFASSPEMDFFKFVFWEYIVSIIFRVVVSAFDMMPPAVQLLIDSTLLCNFLSYVFLCGNQQHGVSEEMKFIFHFILFTLLSYVSALIGPFLWTRFAFEMYLLAYMRVRWGTVVMKRKIEQI